MTTIDAILREHITRYIALQQKDGEKTRIPSAFGSMIIRSAIPDSKEIIDAFVDLVVEATLSLGETYFSGITSPDLYATTFHPDRTEYGPVKGGEQLVHCHLWEKPVGFGVQHGGVFNGHQPSGYISHEGQEPLAEVYIPKGPRPISFDSPPGQSLIDRVQEDGRLEIAGSRVRLRDVEAVMMSSRGFFDHYEVVPTPQEDAFIQCLLRKDSL